jgi:hypothetical protein
MSQLPQKIMDLCSGNTLQKQVSRVIKHLQLQGEEKDEVESFFETRLVDLYKMSLQFSLESDEDDHEEAEIDEIHRQFRIQLNYWWLGVQSDWIRYNNLMNYKQAFMGEKDRVLQSKGSICSYFLDSVSRYLDEKELEANMQNLKNLVKRSEFSDHDS